MPSKPRTIRPPGSPTKRKRLSSDGVRLRGSQATKRRLRILARDGFRCVLCQRPKPEEKLQVDHIIPLHRGGPDQESNMQTVCIPCHLLKTQQENQRFL